MPTLIDFRDNTESGRVLIYAANEMNISLSEQDAPLLDYNFDEFSEDRYCIAFRFLDLAFGIAAAWKDRYNCVFQEN